jgi:hypothetical protein
MRRTAATRTDVDTQWLQSAQQLAAFPSRKRGENRGILFENAAKGWPVVLKPHSKSAPNGGGDLSGPSRHQPRRTPARMRSTAQAGRGKLQVQQSM